MTAFNVSAGIGGGLGLFTGGFVTAGFGWRGVFWLSCVLAVIMLVGSLVAHVVQGRRRVSSATVAEAEAAGIAAEFTISRGLVAGIAANLLVYINYSIWVVALALFATAKFGAGPEELGILLLTVNVMHLVSAFPAGWLIRRAGSARTMVIAFVCAAVGMVFVVLAPTLPLLTPAMALVAAGQMAGNSATGDLVLRLGGGGGRAVGLVRLTSDIGLVVGPVMVGVLADLAGVQAPFLVLAGLTLAGAIATLWFSRPNGQPSLPATA
jgi:MFS family permease